MLEGGEIILCIKDVQLVGLPNKEVTTVSTAIFDHWICRFGVLVDLVTDQGK